MNTFCRGLLAGAIALGPVLVSAGCEVEGPVIAPPPPPVGVAQVDFVDAHGYHHHGWYDNDHHWHGGYYDEHHAYHGDAHDWHP